MCVPAGRQPGDLPRESASERATPLLALRPRGARGENASFELRAPLIGPWPFRPRRRKSNAERHKEKTSFEISYSGDSQGEREANGRRHHYENTLRRHLLKIMPSHFLSYYPGSPPGTRRFRLMSLSVPAVLVCITSCRGCIHFSEATGSCAGRTHKKGALRENLMLPR